MGLVEFVALAFDKLKPHMTTLGIGSLLVSLVGGASAVWGAAGKLTIPNVVELPDPGNGFRIALFVFGLIVLFGAQVLFLWSVRKDPVKYMQLEYRLDDGTKPALVLACPELEQSLALTTVQLMDQTAAGDTWLDLVSDGRHYPRLMPHLAHGTFECHGIEFFGKPGPARDYVCTLYAADMAAHDWLTHRIVGWDVDVNWPGIPEMDWKSNGLTPIIRFTARRCLVVSRPAEAPRTSAAAQPATA